jgi:hypothetical protein
MKIHPLSEQIHQKQNRHNDKNKAKETAPFKTPPTQPSDKATYTLTSAFATLPDLAKIISTISAPPQK